MSGGVYRLAAIMLVICMVTTIIAISIGYLSTSALTIDYHEKRVKFTSWRRRIGRTTFAGN